MARQGGASRDRSQAHADELEQVDEEEQGEDGMVAPGTGRRRDEAHHEDDRKRHRIRGPAVGNAASP